MTRISTRALVIICSLLLVYQPLAQAGVQASLGRITPQGHVKLNGTVATTETTVFAGDVITAARGSRAWVTLAAGGQLVLLGGSSFQMERNADRLTGTLAEGGLVVLSQARTPLFVETAGARIHPPKQGGFFLLKVDGNSVRVDARKGVLTFEAADFTVNVPEGMSLVANMVPAAQGPVGAGSGKRLSKAATIALAAVVVGAITGIGLALSGGDDCTVVSPNQIQCP